MRSAMTRRRPGRPAGTAAGPGAGATGTGGCGRGRRGRRLQVGADVVGDDPPARSAAADLGQLKRSLARQAARQRRCEHPAAGACRRGRGGDCRFRLGFGLLGRTRGGPIGLPVGDRLALGQHPGADSLHLDRLAGAGGYSGQGPVGRGLDLGVDLVGLKFQYRVALGDAGAFVDQPAGDDAFLHRDAHQRHQDWRCHQDSPQQVAHAGRDVGDAGEGPHFQGLRERHRGVLGAQPLDRRVEVVERELADLGRDFTAESAKADRLVDHHRAVGLAHRGQDGLDVERVEGAQVDYFDLGPLAGQLLGRFEGEINLPRIGHDGRRVAAAHHLGLAERNEVLAGRDRSAAPVQGLVFKEADHVIVADGRLEQPLGIVWIRGGDDLQAGHVGEPGLQALGVLGGVAHAGPGRGPVNDRQGGLAAEHVAVLGRLVHDLVHGDAHEVLVHELGYRPRTGDRRPDRRPGD